MTPPAESGASAPSEGWRTHAFGVGLSLSFPAPGLPRRPGPENLPQAMLELAGEEDLDRAWSPQAPSRLLEETFEGERPDRTIDFDEELGYRLYAKHFGAAVISPDGARVRCAPPPVAEWRWQRFLVGRVLPWTALLRGREVFHASAVRLGDRAVALVAPTGGGKTSLAIQLVLRGAGFITDDVLAMERTEDGVAAHPGAALVAVRDEERDRIDAESWKRLGRVLGEEGKTYVEVEREARSLPLGAVYFLGAREGEAGAIHGGVDARNLLGSTFISSVASPMRLTSLLEICSVISATVPTFRVSLGNGIDAGALAGIVMEHAEGAAAS